MKNNKVVYAWYAHNLPFYIGIGSVKRSHRISGRNPYCRNKRVKAERENCFEIRILHKNLSWQQACELEQSYISMYGRVNNGTGILTNMTEGGEGRQGYKHTPETKKKMSLSKQGKSNHRRGKRHSVETKRKILLRNPNCKPVMTPLGEFDSCGQAAKILKCSKATVSRRAKNKNFSEYYFS